MIKQSDQNWRWELITTQLSIFLMSRFVLFFLNKINTFYRFLITFVTGIIRPTTGPLLAVAIVAYAVVIWKKHKERISLQNPFLVIKQSAQPVCGTNEQHVLLMWEAEKMLTSLFCHTVRKPCCPCSRVTLPCLNHR